MANKIEKEKSKRNIKYKAIAKSAKNIKAYLEKIKNKAKKSNVKLSIENFFKTFIKLSFFNVRSLFKKIVKSDISRRVYKRLGYIVNIFRKLFKLYT